MKTTNSNPDFVAMEQVILKFWEENKCFEKLCEKNREGKPFRFLDGPITANNPMGVHHAWGRTLKDIFLRYKSLRGYSCHYQNGFDCQGLWVEVEVEKELNFQNKLDIKKYGLDNFSNACKKRITKYSTIQIEQSKRLGQMMDWENSYYTHQDANILGIWHFLRKCHENGWLYQSSHPMPWCTRCGTSLSEHEMTGSYKEMSHLAVILKLSLKELDAQILVWTTTPWTLSANVALAINPHLEYCKVEIQGEEKLSILCKNALSILEGRKYKVIETFSGRKLIDLSYSPIFPEFSNQMEFKYKVVPWSKVDPAEGTGVVHIAPGCGKEDYELGKELGLPVISPVDEEGIYAEGFGWLEGKQALLVANEVA